MKSESLINLESIEDRIIKARGMNVMIDADLAELYGVNTKALNQAVKRNKERFPSDFVFQLNKKEKIELVTNCDHLSRLKYSSTLPYAFTEHGALMVANVLKSDRAVKISVYVVRAFIKLREMLLSHKELAEKLKALEIGAR
jgi:phage regulator Rha-like protein